MQGVYRHYTYIYYIRTFWKSKCNCNIVDYQYPFTNTKCNKTRLEQMETKKDGKSIGGNGENWSEARLQSECFQYHWGAYQNERGLLHANNNNSHNKIKGNINKALGVVEGVADMEYVGLNCMYFIEMKLPGQKQSKAQIDFQDKVTRLGHEYLIIEYLDAFKLLCRDMRNGLRVYDSDHYNRLVRLGMYYL